MSEEKTVEKFLINRNTLIKYCTHDIISILASAGINTGCLDEKFTAKIYISPDDVDQMGKNSYIEFGIEHIYRFLHKKSLVDGFPILVGLFRVIGTPVENLE